MIEVSLAKALKLRKRLREHSDNLKRILINAGVSYKLRDGAPTFTEEGLTYEELQDKFFEASKDLAFLNSEIDSANMKEIEGYKSVRYCLNELESKRSQLSYLEIILDKVKSFQQQVEVWDPRKFNEKTKELGDMDIIEYRLFINSPNNIKTYKKNLKIEIEDLEEKIEYLNINITISLDDRFKNYLYN